MIKVDESDPVGELEPSFPYKDISIRRGVDMKEHYELQSEIGRGKFGTVFKCREKATNLMLAAKFVGIVHKQDRRNVEREVEIMCELQHPRLIQLYDAFEANNAMCFILELVEGGELFERVIGDDFVLTEKAVTIFMRQICEGVQFIHSKNILHLDLKPENILCLTKTGNRIKIIDFGLARKFNPENKLQVLFGTPEFVAPEVVNFDAIGFGTDMWSVGVICYVLLSGLSPFMGETEVETMTNVTIAKYDFDDEAFDSISNDAKDFIKKLLVKDHKSRPTATECLSHQWLQKKKPKKMVRKSSSKKLIKQTEGKTKPDTLVTNQNVPLLLDVSKDNLKEFCNKSRSPSPIEIVTVSPSLAQLRIQRDSKLLKLENDVGSKGTRLPCEIPAVVTTVLPQSNPDKVCDKVGQLPVISSSENNSKTKNTTTPNELQTNFNRLQTTSNKLQITSDKPQIIPECLQSNLGHLPISELLASSGLLQSSSKLQSTSEVQLTSELQSTTSKLQSTSGLQSTSELQSISGLQSDSKLQSTSEVQSAPELQPTPELQSAPELQSTPKLQSALSKLNQVKQVTLEKLDTQNSNIKPTIASSPVDILSCEVNSQRKSTWSQSTLMTNSSCRRSSDGSFMFSSFKTTSTTMSSDFMESDLQGLSEGLQDFHTMFDNRNHQMDIDGGNLHKLLLNRQQLTATVTDRKPKFKFTSRDVPVGSPPPASNLMYHYLTSSSCRSAPHSKRASPEHDSTSAKEMLLKLFYGDKTTEPKLST